MVAISKLSAALIAALPTLSSAWVVGLYSTQNTCGGDWVPDREIGGVSGETSDCKLAVTRFLKAIRVEDWDDGCTIEIFEDLSCGGDPYYVYEKNEAWPTQDKYTCMADQESTLEDFWAFKYNCG